MVMIVIPVKILVTPKTIEIRPFEKQAWKFPS